MAYPNRGFLALALSLLFLLSGPLSQFSLPESPIIELESSEIFLSAGSDSNEVTISTPNGIGIGPLIEMDATHAMQTISFNVAAGSDARDTGFDWDDWNHTGFSKQGLTLEDDGSLALGIPRN